MPTQAPDHRAVTIRQVLSRNGITVAVRKVPAWRGRDGTFIAGDVAQHLEALFELAAMTGRKTSTLDYIPATTKPESPRRPAKRPILARKRRSKSAA